MHLQHNYALMAIVVGVVGMRVAKTSWGQVTILMVV